MDQHPLRFVWRAAPAPHLAALALVAAALPLGFLGLDLVRAAVDAMAGRPPPTGIAGASLAHALAARLGPLLGLGGSGALALAIFAALAALLGLGAATRVGLGLLRARIEAGVLARLRDEALAALLAARPTARDEVQEMAALVGEGAARQAAFLGQAVLRPALAGGLLGVGLLYGFWTGWPLAAAMLAGLVVCALAKSRALAAEQRRAALVAAEGAALRRAGADLARRLPAIRAHGTGRFEQRRLREELGLRRRTRRAHERQAALMRGVRGLADALAPVLVLGAGAALVGAGAASPGQAVAAALATLVGARVLDRLASWQASTIGAAQLLAQTAALSKAIGAPRQAALKDGDLPAFGALRVEDAASYDAATGARVSGVDLALSPSSHLALVGDAGSGAGVLAALMGGRLEPSSGRVTYGEVDLRRAGAEARARRIGHVGPNPILVPGTLRANLVYGCPDPDGPALDRRLVGIVEVVGLGRLAYARGLAGTVDPDGEPELAARIVEARTALRERLGASGLVDPFDRGRYNHHATLARNILFGVPRGDAFRESNLARHPYLHAVLEAEGLARPLREMGLAIAASMIEIFSDLPDGHPLFERYALFPARERGYFADLIERGGAARRGPGAARDRRRLLGLSLRYTESRHRLGLIDAALERRLLGAREAFHALLPGALRPAIAFYEPDELNPAANLQDNLLFGRVAHDRAGAEAEVQAVIRAVLADHGLDGDVLRVGLRSRVDPGGDDLDAAAVAAVDLARCLVRDPEFVVVERLPDGLTSAEADALVQRLRRAREGRSLVLAVPDLTPAMDVPPFDRVLRFERGAVVGEERRGAVSAAA